MEGASDLGTTFCPAHTHTEIIECLHGLITGSERHSGISNITFADVYSAAPYILVAQHAQGGHDSGHGGPCYFLSPVRSVSETSKRKSRAVDGTDGKGRWHTEAGRKRVEGTAGGYMSTFSYQEKTASGTTRPGAWLMVEYSIAGCDNLVIAKIYRSPRRQATNVSAPVTNKILQVMDRMLDRMLMSDDAGGAVESLQAELANYTCFPNHGALQYAIAGQYNVSGAAAAAHGAPQFFAGQYDVSGAAAAAHGAPQFFAGQYDVSGAAAADHGAPQFFAGQYEYDVSGAATADHGAPQFFAGQYDVSGAAAADHGAPQFLAGQYNVSGAAAAAHGEPQFLAGQYNVSSAAATAYGAPQFLAGHYNVSGASQASAAHYLTAATAAAAALQVSPGHADHANKVVLGHNQTVLGARYEVQGQVAQHLIPETAIVVGEQRMLADDVVMQPHIASTSGGLANLDFDADLYGCLANLDFDADLYPW